MTHNSSPDWARLPAPVLENIYCFLNRDDQRRMSVTCRCWSEEYAAPRLWRNFEFSISGYEKKIPDIRLAQRFGHLIQHAKIISNEEPPRKGGFKKLLEVLKAKWDQTKLFLRALTDRSQLLTFSLISKDGGFDLMANTMYEPVYQSILNLFVSQNRLRSIKFSGVDFRKFHAAELFRVICVNNFHTLRVLKFPFWTTLEAGDIPVNLIDEPSTCATFMNLREIECFDTPFFQSILRAFSEHHEDGQQGKGSLERMKVTWSEYNTDRYQGIPSAAWKSIAEKCPLLKIELSLIHYPEGERRIGNSIETIVVGHMPITKFGVGFRYESYSDLGATRMEPVFRHLSAQGVNSLLENLTLEHMMPCLVGAALADDLKRFLQTCPKLKVLQLGIGYGLHSLDDVLNFWTDIGIMELEREVITTINIGTNEEQLIGLFSLFHT